MRKTFILVVVLSLFCAQMSSQTDNVINRIIHSESYNPGFERLRIASSPTSVYLGGRLNNLFYYAEGKALAPASAKAMFVAKYDHDLETQKVISINAVFKDLVCLGDDVMILADFKDSCTIGDTTIYSNRPSSDHTGFFACLDADLETVHWITLDYFENASSEIYFIGNFDLSSDSENSVYVSGVFTDSLALGDTLLHCTKYLDIYPQRNAFIAKYDKDGKFKWGKVLEGDEGSLVLDSELNMYVIDSRSDTRFSKYDRHGNEIFSRTIATEEFYASSMQCDSKDNVFISLFVKKSTLIDGVDFQMVGSWDNAIMKYNKEGTLQWMSQIGRTHTYMPPAALAVDNRDNLYSLGNNLKDNVTFSDIVVSAPSEAFYMAKWNEDGSVIWIEYSQNSNGAEESIGIALQGNKAFYLFNAESDGKFLNGNLDPVFNPDYFLGRMTLQDAAGIADPNSLADDGLTVYPNPANGTCRVSFDLKHSDQVNISAIDYCGKRVEEFYNGFLNADKHEMELNLEDLSPGLYIISVTSGTLSLRKSMLVIQ